MADDPPAPALRDQYAHAREDAKAVQEEICRRIMEGESVRAICSDASMPDKSTIMRWLASDPEFRADYALAKQLQAEILADEIKEIADTPVIGVKVISKADGTAVHVEGDMIDHRRLQIDARKWLAAKLAPKRYGDASMLRIGEADAAAHRDMTREEVVTRLAAIFSKVRSGKD